MWFLVNIFETGSKGFRINQAKWDSKNDARFPLKFTFSLKEVSLNIISAVKLTIKLQMIDFKIYFDAAVKGTTSHQREYGY